MRLLVAVVGLSTLAACGGAQIPPHSGYKSDKSKPWKSPKALKFDEKLEAKAEGDLNYANFKRARWYSLDLNSTSELDLRLEVTPPGDATNDDFDLAMEVLDPGFRVISKSDLEEEDAHEQNKTRQLLDLPPGHYLIHLYLQSRVDSCEYILHATIKTTAAAERKSDFPAQVAFIPAMPQVPLQDDTPKGWKPPEQPKPPKPPVRTGKRTPQPPPKKDEPPPPPTSTITARIQGVRVVSGGTQITISRGTASGAAPTMHVKINGISGTFVATCGENSCTATVNATPDQLKGTVVLTP
jgi:hypothetical protein